MVQAKLINPYSQREKTIEKLKNTAYENFKGNTWN
jgi:hypothetical protein